MTSRQQAIARGQIHASEEGRYFCAAMAYFGGGAGGGGGFDFGGLFGGMVGGGGGGGGPLTETLRAFSLAAAGRSEVGDKILLPPSMLDELTRRVVQYPLLFRLEAMRGGAARFSHAGVLEFTAVEGRCHLPAQAMASLRLAEGAFIVVRNVQLPKARFVKLQPERMTFLDLKNPRAVLERALRVYSAVTKGDILDISHAGVVHRLTVLECKPAVSARAVEEEQSAFARAARARLRPPCLTLALPSHLRAHRYLARMPSASSTLTSRSTLRRRWTMWTRAPPPPPPPPPRQSSSTTTSRRARQHRNSRWL